MMVPGIGAKRLSRKASVLLGINSYLTLLKVRARGGNISLTLHLSPDGEMPHWFYSLCDQLAAWMKTGAEAIYNINTSGPFPYPDQCAQPVTVGSNAWYVFLNTKPETFEQPLVIKDVEKPANMTLLQQQCKNTI